MYLLQGICLNFNCRDFVDMFAVVLKDYTTLEMIRNGLILLWIDYNGLREIQCDFSGILVHSLRMSDGKTHVIGKHSDDHLLFILHLALHMIIVGAANEKSNVHERRTWGNLIVFLKRGCLRAKQYYGSVFRIIPAIDFLKERE